MKNKMPLKYRIIFIVLILPELISSLVSILTPYDLWSNPVIFYAAIFFELFGVGVLLYGMYITSRNQYHNK